MKVRMKNSVIVGKFLDKSFHNCLLRSRNLEIVQKTFQLFRENKTFKSKLEKFTSEL